MAREEAGRRELRSLSFEVVLTGDYVEKRREICCCFLALNDLFWSCYEVVVNCFHSYNDCLSFLGFYRRGKFKRYL